MEDRRDDGKGCFFSRSNYMCWPKVLIKWLAVPSRLRVYERSLFSSSRDLLNQARVALNGARLRRPRLSRTGQVR